MADTTLCYSGPIVTCKEARALGLKRYFPGTACKKAGHIAERYLDGACIACKAPGRTLPDVIGVFYEGPIVTRAEAIAKGLTHFFTGLPCKNGHVAQRYIGQYRCSRCVLDRGTLTIKRRTIDKVVVLYEGPKISRSEARSLGLPRYFTNIPCKRGHVDQRTVSNATCDACRKLSRAAGTKHRTKRNAARRSPAARPKLNAAERKWRNKNPDKVLQRSRQGRARKRKAPGSFTVEEERKLRERQKKCHICGKRFTKTDPATIDHVVALNDHGPHVASNIALAHKSCNSSKQDKRTHLI
jgi:ribosomal protein L34E